MAGTAFQDRQLQEVVQLLQSGRLAEAEGQIQQVARMHPNRFEPQHLAAVIAFQAGKPGTAIEKLQGALRIDPTHAQGLSDLGMMLQSAGRRDEAEAALARAVELAPDMAAAHLNLGNLLSETGKSLRAEKHYREALRLNPRLGAALYNLSRILLSSGKAAEAADLARRLIALAPKNALGHSRLGAALDRLGRLDEALAAHREAVALKPDDSTIRLEYTLSLAGYGRLDEAVAELRALLDEDPENVAALTQLAGVLNSADDSELYRRIEVLWNRGDMPSADRAPLGFVLGRAQERRKEYGAAFANFARANRMMREGVRYDPGTLEANEQDTKAAFGAATFARLSGGYDEETPIFIVGMPRSGTTLTEQILCAHEGVFGAGEPSIMRSVADAAAIRVGASSLTELMQRVDEGELNRIGQDYVGLLRQYSAGAERIIDKVPANYRYVGLIHLSLPNAKIIHCKRAAADTCLSIFKTRFAAGSQLFAYDLDELAATYAAYQRLMAHWDEVMPGVVHSVQYERMVADQEGQSRALYAHCGLEWTDEAMRFFQTERPVHTASISQVRQPIYDSSKGIAGRYGEAARPLIDALERAGVDPFSV